MQRHADDETLSQRFVPAGRTVGIGLIDSANIQGRNNNVVSICLNNTDGAVFSLCCLCIFFFNYQQTYNVTTTSFLLHRRLRGIADLGSFAAILIGETPFVT